MICCFLADQFAEVVFSSISTQKLIVLLANMFSTKPNRISSKFCIRFRNFKLFEMGNYLKNLFSELIRRCKISYTNWYQDYITKRCEREESFTKNIRSMVKLYSKLLSIF